ADESNEYFFQEGCFILELSNTESDPNLSVARARVEPGRTTSLHRLQGVVERYVILEGEGRIEIGDLPSQEVGEGDVAIIPPDCPQRIENIGTGDLVFLALCTPRFKKEFYLDLDVSPVI
ncbi:MAG: cupin domain-containing protein, partial [Desulfovibrionales bacterium]